jgi:hypothetical protein
MAIQATNWFGDIDLQAAKLVEVHSVQDIIQVLQDKANFPPPVRANGPSSHSTTLCGVADGGTILRLSTLNIKEDGSDIQVDADKLTVTAPAGRYYVDVARKLDKRGLQLYVNTEIGKVSLGAAACSGTKDASLPGEFGQVGSYVIGVKIIFPSGENRTVTQESDPDLLHKIRSSHGLFGVIHEVTMRVRPTTPLAVHHETFKLADFVHRLPELKSRDASMMFYLFPFDDMITVEFRKHNPTGMQPLDDVTWELRNFIWETEGPLACRKLETLARAAAILPLPTAGLLNPYRLLDEHSAAIRFKLNNLIHSPNTRPMKQMIDYPQSSDARRYTFALWAFPEEHYPTVLPAFFQFSRDYFQKTGYRANLPNVGYRIAKDQNALLSYSFNGDVMTIDPVSTGDPLGAPGTGLATFWIAKGGPRRFLPAPAVLSGLTRTLSFRQSQRLTWSRVIWSSCLRMGS